MTRAKRDILGMSEEEIRNDLEQQRLEKAVAAEMEQTSNVIKKTGIFDRVDTLYGEFGTTAAEGASEEAGSDAGDTGGGFGGDAGGGGDFGAEIAGGMESAAATEAGAEVGGEIAGAEAPVEAVNKKGDLLTEEKKNNIEKKAKKYQNIYLKKLLESIDNDEKIFNLDSVDKDSERVNTKIEDMSNEIDKLIK
jgi:hypothetical protein